MTGSAASRATTSGSVVSAPRSSSHQVSARYIDPVSRYRRPSAQAAPRDALDLPAPDGPSTATTSPDPRSVSLSSARPAEVFTRATLPGHESVPVRVTHGLGAVTRADLRQHVVDVAFHRRLADHQAPGDLRVGQARRDEREDLGLTRGQ